jgi:hypothetical protein
MPFKEDGGQTKFSEIASAFGGKKPHAMSEYYKNGRYIQDRLNYINAWPDGETTFTHAANTRFLIRAVVQPAINERIKLTGKRQYADSNQAKITEVTPYRDTVDNFAGLPVATQEFYGDVYRIKCNKAITFGLNSYDTAGHGEEFERFSRGNFLITRANSIYTASDMESIRFNPSSDLPSEDRSKAEGTQIKVSNLHGAYDKTTTKSKDTSKSTSKTTAGIVNTSFTTTYGTAKSTTYDTSFTTTYSTAKDTSKNTTKTTTYGTDLNTVYDTIFTQTWETTLSIYHRRDTTVSRVRSTTKVTQKSTSRSTAKSTTFSTDKDTSKTTKRSTSKSTNKNTSKSTTRSTSGITTYNTTFGTTTSFWE